MKMKQLVRMMRRLRIQGGVIKSLTDPSEDKAIVACQFALVTVKKGEYKSRYLFPVKDPSTGEIRVDVILTIDVSGSIVYTVNEDVFVSTLDSITLAI